MKAIDAFRFRANVLLRSATLIAQNALMITLAGVVFFQSSAMAEQTIPYWELPRTAFKAVLSPPSAGTTHGAEYGDFTFAGPIRGTLGPLPRGIGEVAGDATGDRLFGMRIHSLDELDLDTGQTTPLVPSGVPEISWAMGITYDHNHDRLLLATLGGEGFLYSYTPDDDSWSVLTSMSNVDVTAIAYYEPLDRVFAVSGWYDGAYLYEYDAASGARLRSRPLDLPFLGNFIDRSLQLLAVDDYLAFVQVPRAPKGRVEPVIHAIDPNTAEVWRVVAEPSTCWLLIAGAAFLVARLVSRKRGWLP